MSTPTDFDGDILTVHFSSGDIRYQLDPAVRYDYAKAGATCPGCGGVGTPWGGWFSCDDTCGSIALVETGQFFRAINPHPG